MHEVTQKPAALRPSVERGKWTLEVMSGADRRT